MEETILKHEERAVYALRSLYRSYGYGPYKMSRFEEYDLYVRNKDFLVSDQIITFSDRSGRLLALKPDVTLSIVKNAPEEPGVVQKVYYDENVYRDYREIMQAGLECVGDLGEYEIAEAVLLAAMSLEKLGGRFVLNLSHMGLVAAVLEELRPELKKQALSCLGSKNLHGLREICQGYPQVWEKLERLAACRGRGDQVLYKLDQVLTGDFERQALRQLQTVWTILDSAGYGDSVRLDFSVRSNMSYYSGVVFTGYLDGVPAAVLSGGQYDRLLEKMGRRAKAIGFAIYLDQLQGLNKSAFDVDTVILHDGTAQPDALMAASRLAAQSGSVLVSRTLPTDRRWRRLVRFENGEAREIE